MAPKPARRPSSGGSGDKLDLDPKAWPRFEALIKNAAKMGHKPHDRPITKKRNAPRKAKG